MKILNTSFSETSRRRILTRRRPNNPKNDESIETNHITGWNQQQLLGKPQEKKWIHTNIFLSRMETSNRKLRCAVFLWPALGYEPFFALPTTGRRIFPQSEFYVITSLMQPLFFKKYESGTESNF